MRLLQLFLSKCAERHEDGLLIECAAVNSEIIINLRVGGFFLSSGLCS